MALVVIVGYVLRMSTRYVITNERLHIRHGVITRHIQQARLERVQDMSVKQRLFERMLMIGTVDFDTAGGDRDEDFAFRGVAHPEKVMQEVDQAIRQSRDERDRRGAPGSGSVAVGRRVSSEQGRGSAIVWIACFVGAVIVGALVIAWHGTDYWDYSEGVYALTSRLWLHGHTIYRDTALAQPPAWSCSAPARWRSMTACSGCGSSSARGRSSARWRWPGSSGSSPPAASSRSRRRSSRCCCRGRCTSSASSRRRRSGRR